MESHPTLPDSTRLTLWRSRPGPGRRRASGLAAALLLLLWAGACDAERPTVQRLNVVMVSIDTLRPDHLGCYGYERPTSRHIDALASIGILFENAFSHSSRTAPAHMTMFTGLLPESHGVVNFDQDGNTRLPEGVATLASHLEQQGFHTVGISGGGNVKAAMGFDRGFDSWSEVPHGPGAVEATFDAGIQAIQAAQGEPLFLFLHTYAVHDPYVPPADFAQAFLDPNYNGEIIGSQEQLSAAAGPEWIDQHRLYWSRVASDDSADIQHLKDLYDGAIARVDAQIGRLMEAIERNGLRKRTLLILTSDHGEEFGEHGGFQHGSLYEECLRVPLILVPPPAARRSGLQMPARITHPVGLVDLMPTILGTLKLPVPQDIEGHSLRRMLLGAAPGASQIVAAYPRRKLSSLRVGELKLILDETRMDSELYDLRIDPDERINEAWQAPDLHRDLMEQLQLLRDRSRLRLQASGGAPPALLDDEARRHLEALGYLDPAADGRR